MPSTKFPKNRSCFKKIQHFLILFVVFALVNVLQQKIPFFSSTLVYKRDFLQNFNPVQFVPILKIVRSPISSILNAINNGEALIISIKSCLLGASSNTR